MIKAALFTSNRQLIESVTAGINKNPDVIVQLLSSTRCHDAHEDIQTFEADYVFIDSMEENEIVSAISFCRRLRKETQHRYKLCVLIRGEDAHIADKAKRERIVDAYILITDFPYDFFEILTSL